VCLKQQNIKHLWIIGKNNTRLVVVLSDYMHNDDVAELLHAKDVEISDLRKQVSKLLQHLEEVRTANFYAVESILHDGL